MTRTKRFNPTMLLLYQFFGGLLSLVVIVFIQPCTVSHNRALFPALIAISALNCVVWGWLLVAIRMKRAWILDRRTQLTVFHAGWFWDLLALASLVCVTGGSRSVFMCQFASILPLVLLVVRSPFWTGVYAGMYLVLHIAATAWDPGLMEYEAGSRHEPFGWIFVALFVILPTYVAIQRDMSSMRTRIVPGTAGSDSVP
jgi:hypothetical protein